MLTSPRRSTLAALVCLVLLGLALRTYHINRVPLRGDEIFTVALWMRQPLAQTIDTIASSDPQPPLAYAVYRAWALLVGTDDRLARMLPALLNVLGIPLLYALGHRLGNRRVGLVAALLWALHPFQIWHSQDARNYAIWSSASAGALWLGLIALQRNRPLDWALYILVAIAACYLYYLELFMMAAVSVYVLVTCWRNRPLLMRWTAAQVVIVGALALWIVQGRLAGGYGGTTGGFDIAQLWTRFPTALAFGERTLPGKVTAWLWVPVLVILVGALIVLWRYRWKSALLLTLVMCIPSLLLGLVSLRLNVFTPRYVLGTAPALVLVVSSLFVYRVREGHVLQATRVFVLSLWLFVGAYSLYNLHFVADYTKSPDWHSLMAYLSEHVSPDDSVVQASADEAFNYYYNAYAIPAERKQLPANTRQSVEEITGLLDADLTTHRSLWRLLQTFPDWPNYGVVERWIEEHMQEVRRDTVSGIRVQQFMAWDVAPTELAPAPLATFENTARLVGASVDVENGANRAVHALLYWQPLAQTDTPLTVSVQLIGAVNAETGSPLWAQDDHPPQHGRIATTTWSIDQVYRDVFTLSLEGVPAGEYSLEVRLYDPSTGDRVPVDGRDGYRLQVVYIQE